MIPWRAFPLILAACGSDTFFSFPPDASEAGSDAPIDALELDANYIDGAADDAREAGDGSIEAAPDAPPPPMCDPGDVTYGGKCFYLDGSAGVCANGYVLSSDAALGAVLAGNVNAFQGKNYRTMISASCCVFTSDQIRNFGMVTHCNVAGPFGAGEPKYGGNNCLNISVAVKPNHLTLCERPL